VILAHPWRCPAVEYKREVKPQPRISPHGQQQLVEGRDAGGQLGAVAQHPPAIDDRAHKFGGEPRATGDWLRSAARCLPSFCAPSLFCR
jgi:hypothetical protein